ncbi:hypothetical protein ACLVWU_14265 [Bdellovibrio sp. HCB290]|uniref:hypothetical protein n=1 Tax=Bdellovibrio sp. HCB290 TaxID=3394356 RepID=UPI0039B47407
MTNRSELFRARLQTEFQNRVKAHGKYSFRAFAHSLKIDPSSLHDIMKGERKVGEKIIRRLGECIGMSLEEIEQVLNPPLLK